MFLIDRFKTENLRFASRAIKNCKNSPDVTGTFEWSRHATQKPKSLQIENSSVKPVAAARLSNKINFRLSFELPKQRTSPSPKNFHFIKNFQFFAPCYCPF